MAGSRAQATDEELVRRVRAGDESAAHELFERHVPALRARVRRRLPRSLRPKVGESDVIQEAYLAAFLHLDDFEDRGEGSFARWAATVLERKILNEIRHFLGTARRDAAREVRGVSTASGPAVAARDPSPSTAAGNAEEMAAVLREIEGLPRGQGTVLRLIHEERLTLEEAGRRMGRSAEAVRKLYGRALHRLAQRMKGRDRPSG